MVHRNRYGFVDVEGSGRESRTVMIGAVDVRAQYQSETTGNSTR